MPPLSVDSWTIESDVRFAECAELYPYDPETNSGFADEDHCRGKIERVWLECLQRQTDQMSEARLRLRLRQPQARLQQLVEALLKSELARRTDDAGVLVMAGTAKRIEWLRKMREGGAKGGKAKRKRKDGKSKPSSSLAQACEEAPLKGVRPPTATTTTTTTTKSFSYEKDVELPPPGDSSEPPGEHQEFVRFFDALFREAHGGAKPTWNGKTGAIVKRLLKAHGLAECQRRASVLFESPPDWIQTRDLQTLSQHFDKLTQPTLRVGRAGGVGGHVLRDREYFDGEVDL